MELENVDNYEKRMELTDEAIDALRGSAKWSMFLAIIGFIGIGFMVVLSFFIGAIFSAAEMPGNPMQGFGGIMSGLYILIAIIYFFPIYYLFKYSSGMKNALLVRDSSSVGTALVYLKSHHKFLGICMIVLLSLYALIFVGAIVVGLTGFL